MSGRLVVLCAWCGNEGKWSRFGRGGSLMCGRCRSKMARRLDEKDSHDGQAERESVRREDAELGLEKKR